MHFSETDQQLLSSLMRRLGLTELWLCRGAVRCDLLDELQAWDDFDLMAEVSEIALREAFERSGISTSPTFHGGYSLRLDNGRKADVWSLTRTRGRRCTSLEEALGAFEFNVDAIARSVRTWKVVDPLLVESEITQRLLRVQGAEANLYLPWKAAYLVLRHQLVPDQSVLALWEKAPSLEGLPDKAVKGLQEELGLLHIRTDMPVMASSGDS